MEKTRKYAFSKVAWYGSCKSNLIELSVTLTDRNGYPEFTACGGIWNHIHTDWIAGGQCLDTIIERFPQFKHNTLYRTIFELWQKYHLKDVSNIPSEDRAKIDLLVSDLPSETVVESLKE